MKVTLKQLRQIITEEIIKEELSADIAAPAIAAMLQGTDSVATSDIFGAVFDEMYGEGALEGEAERMAGAEEEPEEDFPTEYQPGGGEGDRPRMGFVKENISKIIQEELEDVLNERFQDPDRATEQDASDLWLDSYGAMRESDEVGLKEKNNPWAICTASVGREDKDKYEKCVKSVKKEKGIK